MNKTKQQNQAFNPNKARLFEGSFFFSGRGGGGGYLIPPPPPHPSYFKKN